MRAKVAMVLLLASPLAPPAPADAYTAEAIRLPSTLPRRARCFDAAGEKSGTGTETYGAWSRQRSSTVTVRNTLAGRAAARMRTRVGEGSAPEYSAGIARMAVGGDRDGGRDIAGAGDYSKPFMKGVEKKKATHRVIFMRHAESEWNRDNRFLGWADIGLTKDGQSEARKAATTLADSGIHVDEMFCSYLKRSIKSAWVLADELDQVWMPIHPDWRLNEQMYGALEGLNKRATAERYGAELTQQWRRSYDIAPPAVQGGRGYFPVGDPKYAALTQDDIPDSWCGSPNTESLKDAQARSWMFWRERVVPAIRQGKTVMICGHGNIIRSMLKRLDNIPNDTLKQLSIPRASPLVYDLDEDLIPIHSAGSFWPLSGRFLGDPEELRAALEREGAQAQLGVSGIVGGGKIEAISAEDQHSEAISAEDRPIVL